MQPTRFARKRSLTKTEGLAFKVREIIDGVRRRLAPPPPSRPA